MPETTKAREEFDPDLAGRIRLALDARVEAITLQEIAQLRSQPGTPVGVSPGRSARGHGPWMAAAAIVVVLLGVGVTLAIRTEPNRVELTTPDVTSNSAPGTAQTAVAGPPPTTDLGGGWSTLASWPEVGDLGLNGIGREGFSAVAAGNRLIVWGGKADGLDAHADGTVLDVDANTWRALPRAPLSARFAHVAVWTGSEMLLWGGTDKSTEGTPLADGASYNPSTGTWRTIAASPLSGGTGYDAVWTGTEMVVVGGRGGTSTAEGQQPSIRLNEAAAYNPVTDTWRGLPGLPIDLSFLEAHWTGAEVVVVGGQSFNGNGFINRRGPVMLAALDPAADRWREAPEAPVPAQSEAAAWTGDELLVVTYDPASDGSASWDPARNAWNRRDPIGTNGCEDTPTAIAITGGVLAGVCGTIARYDHATQKWTTLTPVTRPDGSIISLYPRSTVFTGDRVVSITGRGDAATWSP